MGRLRLLVVVALASCGGKPDTTSSPAQLAAAAEPAAGAPTTDNVSLADVGLDESRLDKAADPCDDFYRFACGGWMDKTELPADEFYWGTFIEITRRNDQIVHKILEDGAAAPAGGDPVTAKLGAFYGGCMDQDAIDKAGLSALEPTFALTRKVKDPITLMAAVAALHRDGVNVLFGGVNAVQDKKRSTRVIAQLEQGGLGLPDRAYYLEDDAQKKALRDAYLAYVEKMLVLIGRKPAAAKKAAADILALETDLAKSHKTRVELRDEQATYNKVDRMGLFKLAPGLDWDGYMKGIGIPGTDEFNLRAPGAFQALPGIVKRHKPAAWRDYLDFQATHKLAAALPRNIDDAAFAFEQKLTGQKEQRSRWKRCVDFTNFSLGELVAQPFIKAAFPGESKSAAETMVKQIVAAFDANLDTVTWMDDKTKAKAREKLAKIDLMIGYPPTFRKYDFEMDRAKFGETSLRASRWESARQMAKVGKPLDRTDWQMPPALVNAYYDAGLNQMVFPAGILQKPFYDVKSSVAVNLGGIGMFAGHELTHGFDDQGAQYDGDGNLSGWWPQAVTRSFEEKTQCTARYYSGYEVLPGLQLNGALTNGENIADMGGVKLAFKAYRALRKDAPRRTVAGGFTEDQQFFLAMGQAWCEKESDEFLRVLVATNAHSPPRFRVIGALSSTPEFAEAFACKAGAKMKPANSCRIW